MRAERAAANPHFNGQGSSLKGQSELVGGTVGQRHFSSQYQIKELNKHKLKDFVRPDDIADPMLRISTTDSYVSER